MLTFYPEFEVDEDEARGHAHEVILLIDVSCSMEGDALENAKKLALLSLHSMPPSTRFNVVVFGSVFDSLFPKALPASSHAIEQAQAYIASLHASWGATQLWS